MPSIQEFEDFSSLFGGNSVYVEELYERYLSNPQSVDESWKKIFDGLQDNLSDLAKEVHGPSWTQHKAAVIGQVDPETLAIAAANKNKQGGVSEEALHQASFESVRALMLIRAFRVRGHLVANLDPLGLAEKGLHPELDPKTYGFGEDDMDRPILIHGVLGREKASMREIVDILHKTYGRTIGVESMHIQHPEQKAWIQQHFEGSYGQPLISDEEKKKVLQSLMEVEVFENFLQVKYPGMKRFSVQGGDSMVPGIEMALRVSAGLGVEDVNIGMPHRGRMNVLTTIMKKPYVELFSLFHGNLDYPDDVESSGDVKYHLGTSSDREFKTGGEMHLTLTANPSHLEAVNPVVAGRVRGKQDMLDDNVDRKRCMGITLHGDAAFAGQGVVMETLSFGDLAGYQTGGSLRFIVNNQIGFTTTPKFARSSPYPSDVAKMVGCPIFHVNGDDPEAVAYVCKLAAEFRHEFQKDVVIDMFCYRKYGHNESDEPMFTQPLMYKAIKKKTPPAKMYAERLISDSVLTQEEVDAMTQALKDGFERDFESAKNYKPNEADWLAGKWSGMERPSGEHESVETGIDEKTLKEIGHALCKVPEDFDANRKIVRQLDAKREMIDSGKGIDWATAEALAFGSLLKDGYPVRLSGQDSRRGTFSQRHSALIDQSTDEKYYPLNNLGGEQARFEVINSNLSEYGVLGFEYGYSQALPNALTMWEAQFGDFVNGAQIMIDQFITSGEIKWLRMSGLVMLLPHGMEGQGPEHSSARMERFLQACAQDNIQVANCSTPANYYLILRRQLHRNFRKPLILATPKSLLRHKLCVSQLKEMGKGTSFAPVFEDVDKLTSPSKVKRVVICSGKVFYDLLEARREKKIDNVAILRLEQFYPFPAKQLAAAIKPFKNAEIVWCQEEPKNMGGWMFVNPRLEEVMEGLKIKGRPAYAGRPEAASPATGYLKIHEREQKELVDEALK